MIPWLELREWKLGSFNGVEYYRDDCFGKPHGVRQNTRLQDSFCKCGIIIAMEVLFMDEDMYLYNCSGVVFQIMAFLCCWMRILGIFR